MAALSLPNNAADEQPRDSSIFIGNLPWDVTEAVLSETFRAPSVAACRIVRHEDSGRSKGYAIVDFPTADDAARLRDLPLSLLGLEEAARRRAWQDLRRLEDVGGIFRTHPVCVSNLSAEA